MRKVPCSILPPAVGTYTVDVISTSDDADEPAIVGRISATVNQALTITSDDLDEPTIVVSVRGLGI